MMKNDQMKLQIMFARGGSEVIYFLASYKFQ